MPAVLVLISAFKIMMLLDALGRFGTCCGNYWYMVIVLVPGGEFIYFFMVVVHDLPLQQLRQKYFPKTDSLQKLELQFEECPSARNKLALAQAQLENEMYAPALALAEELLANDNSDKDALYICALAKRGLGKLENAAQILENLIATEISFMDYSAAHRLCDVYHRLSRKADCLALCEKVAQKSQRLNHRLVLAKYLSINDQKEDAKKLLEACLHDYKLSPGFRKRADRHEAAHAKKLLQSMAQSSYSVPQK